MTPLVGIICGIGMLLVVPLGLRMIDNGPDPVLVRVMQLWPVAAIAGIFSMAIPRGGLAVALAAVYAAATVALAFTALGRLGRRRSLRPREIAALTALVTPSVAGISLVAERGGWELLGFSLPILALTVAHFHFAGFAAALVAGLVTTTAPSRLADAAALAVPIGTFVVLLGYFTGEGIELLGAVILTAGMWLLGWIVWRDVRPRATTPVLRVLFGVSAVVLAATMVLALSWALGSVWDGFPHLSIPWMVATHGVLNAGGFALCGILAWRQLPARQPL